MFEIKNVSKQYQDEIALNNISFSIEKGLNFIVGASGSGKTTLLKIISGMEQDFDGEVYYQDKRIKELTPTESSYFYNNIFGFVWQDFNLLEDSTVLENVLLPQYLKDKKNKTHADKLLKELKIADLTHQKVKTLSGGQKQRVAIARELMKNPEVIIADEPTSALDEETSKITMDILKNLSKERTVIIVTHDILSIEPHSNILDLDTGEFILSQNESINEIGNLKMDKVHRLPLKDAFTIAIANVKNKFGRFLVSALSFMIASTFLLTTISGAVGGSSQDEFDELIETYGEGLTDISVVGSFISAGDTSDTQEEKPSANVSQDINGLYDKYMDDERVDFTVYLQGLNNISVTVRGKEYQIQGTGSVPSIHKLLAGEMPTGTGNEIVVPESFVKNLGLSNEQAIGEEIDFSSAIFNWDTGEPVLRDALITAKIVGIADTTVSFEYEGQMVDYPVDDSFFFSQAALNDMRKQTGTENEAMNFLIRAKTPADMIAIKDELNEIGIVPLGQFELVEDIVRLNEQTVEQSGSANMLIGILSILMVIAISLITSLMRQREYAIYKISGYNNTHLGFLSLTEKITEMITAVLLMLAVSPLLNIATESLFNTNIRSTEMLRQGALLIVLVGIIAYMPTVFAIVKTNIATSLKTGDRT